MWTRAELKAKAKLSIKRNYIPCILAGLLLLFALGSQQSVTLASTPDLSDTDFMTLQALQVQTTYLLGPMQVVWNNIELMLGGLSTIVFLLLKVFVFNPMEVGGCAFFVENTENMTKLDRIFFLFGNQGYRNVVKVLVIRDVLLYLWFLLFLIPGIYKSYEYYMIPYLLSENPNLDFREAFWISKEMMYGNKWDTLVLEFSFVLWQFLSMLSFGLVGIFFVNPYYHATFAELYRTIRSTYWEQRQAEPDIFVN